MAKLEAETTAAEVVALVKSMGPSALSVNGGTAALKAALMDRKAPGPAQGALATLSSLADSEPLFAESAIVEVLPALFECFNDRAKDVREAATALAEKTMKMVSPLCVKPLLPTLFEGLQHKVRTQRALFCAASACFGVRLGQPLRLIADLANPTRSPPHPPGAPPSRPHRTGR